MKDSAETPEVLAPSFSFTRPNPDWFRSRRQRKARLCERLVTVTNPDGSTTTITYWSDVGYDDTHLD